MRSDPKLEFERGSSVQIAGANFDTTSGAVLMDALQSRGWIAKENECWFESGKYTGCMHRYVEFMKRDDVAGIESISLTIFNNRPVTAEYKINTMENYTQFVRALDGRYGASERASANGCVTRDWESAEVGITASYCKDKPKPFEIYFMNFEQYAYEDVTLLAEKWVRHVAKQPIATGSKTPRRIPPDMF